MATFGVVGEGETDQTVIENILLGYFGRDADVNPLQPLPGEPGGWTLVLHWLVAGRAQEALQFNDFLVIQVDTDRCDDVGFDVSRQHPNEGRARTLDELVQAVRERLIQAMGPTVYAAHADRILFAVTVHSIECWLLPLLVSGKVKQSKVLGCLDEANHALRKAGREGLKAEKTYVTRYRDESAPYRKRKDLMAKGPLSPSLGVFLAELGRLVPVGP